MFKVASVETDYLLCNTWDGSVQGTESIEVALPYILRRTPWDGNTRGNFTYTYLSNVEREISVNNTVIGTEEINPEYLPGDIVYGVKNVSGGTDVVNANGDDVVWLDLNVDARRWFGKVLI